MLQIRKLRTPAVEDTDESAFNTINDLANTLLPPPTSSLPITSKVKDTASYICSCKLHNDLPCYPRFSVELLTETQMQYQALSKSDRDIALSKKWVWNTHDWTNATERPKQKEPKKRERTRCYCYFQGGRICQHLFQYLHCIGEKQLNSLWKQYQDVDVESRVHGRTKQLPSNLLSYKDNLCIVDFIIKYAEQNTVTGMNIRSLERWQCTAPPN